MKKLLFVLLIFISSIGYSQTKGIYIKDTVIKSVTHKLYMGSRGGRYIVVTSKTGTTYNRYISPAKTIKYEISNIISYYIILYIMDNK